MMSSACSFETRPRMILLWLIKHRYKYLVLVSDPNVVMCLRPNCDKGQIPTDKNEPKMICNSCGYATCAKHKLPWHDGKTCAEFDLEPTQLERLEAEISTAKLLAASTQMCPACGNGVTKTSGCDHLQCRCGEEWCFECLASWKRITRTGPLAHSQTCSHDARRVRGSGAEVEEHVERMMNVAHGGKCRMNRRGRCGRDGRSRGRGGRASPACRGGVGRRRRGWRIFWRG